MEVTMKKKICQYLSDVLVEMPEEEMAQRRINFYKRQGFVLWEKPYLQPPYRPGDDYLPMLLMAHGNLERERDFETVKNSIYREVYNVQK